MAMPAKVASIVMRARRRPSSVERDRHDHDGHAGQQRERWVGVEAVGHDVAEPASADQAGDHHQREREHDRLIDREEQLAPRQRQLHLEERLGLRRAQRAGGLDGVGGDAADTERRYPHRGRDRVDHRADDRGRRAHGEQDHHGHQIGEGGDDLHGVKRRGDRPQKALIAPGEHAERHADRKRERHRRQHQRKRLNALLPEAHQREGDKGSRHQQRGAPAAKAENDENGSGQDARPGQPQQHIVERRHEPVGKGPKAVEDREDDVATLRRALVK
jgi:hypothetical protein